MRKSLIRRRTREEKALAALQGSRRKLMIGGAGILAGGLVSPARLASCSAAPADPTISTADGIRRCIDASDPKYGTPGTRAAFIAALDAAEAVGRCTVVYIPAGLVVDVGTGISMAGRTCQIRGDGGGQYDSTNPVSSGSVIRASQQAGPVIDFTGFVNPQQFRGKVTPLSGLVIQGSNKPDPTKANVGVLIDNTSCATFSDLTIANTGGPALKITPVTHGSGTYMCDFERITLVRPVGADVNDVPYLHVEEANCDRFRGIGFMATDTTKVDGNVTGGRSGVALLTGTAGYPSHLNTFDSWWFENVTVPSGGTIVSMSVNECVVRDFQFIDTRKAVGATDTSFITLKPNSANDYGGNRIETLIPGRGSDSRNVDFGIIVEQPYNAIVGSKGFRGYNVVLKPGVERTYVHLRGSQGAGIDPGWIDESGKMTNRLIDEYLGIEIRPTLTTAYAHGGGSKPVTKTSGPYTFGLHDSGRVLAYHNAYTAATFTIPAQASVPWYEGTSFRVINRYMADLNLNAHSGVQLLGTTVLKRGESVTVTRLDKDIWHAGKG